MASGDNIDTIEVLPSTVNVLNSKEGPIAETILDNEGRNLRYCAKLYTVI